MIVQVEHIDAVNCLENIFSVEGVMAISLTARSLWFIGDTRSI